MYRFVKIIWIWCMGFYEVCLLVSLPVCVRVCVCVFVWVAKYCLWILAGANGKVVQALDPNHRVQIQPRFNQSEKTHMQEKKKVLWVCVCVCVFLCLYLDVNVNTQPHKISPTCTPRVIKLKFRLTNSCWDTHTQTVTAHHYLLPSTFPSLPFPLAYKQLIQLKLLFFLYSLSFLLVFINFASLSLSALSIINADILPISSSVPRAIFHRGSVIGGDWPNNNDIYYRYLLSGFVAVLRTHPAEDLHSGKLTSQTHKRTHENTHLRAISLGLFNLHR